MEALDPMEVGARLSTQQFLLEILYANAFARDPAGLDRLMTELVRLSNTASTKPEPISDEDASEMRMRCALCLERFRRSVQDRIRSGRSI